MLGKQRKSSCVHFLMFNSRHVYRSESVLCIHYIYCILERNSYSILNVSNA